MPLPYICLDNYEGIIMKRDSRELDGAIFRGLKTCMGIMVASEQYLLAIHHPGFELSNSFSAITDWTESKDFGAISDVTICVNPNFPRARDMLPSIWGDKLREMLGFEGGIGCHIMHDATGILQVHRVSLAFEELSASALTALGQAQLLINDVKTPASRHHYLATRLHYHRGAKDLCRLKVMSRRAFLDKPCEDDLDREIASHVHAVQQNPKKAIGELARQLSQSALWVKVLDLDLYSSKARHTHELVGRLQHYFLFLEALAELPFEQRKLCRQQIIQLSRQGEIFTSLVKPTTDTTTLLNWLASDNAGEPEEKSRDEHKIS
ncbi:MAG: hypothetical protein P1U61_02270 [Legionellaceae bacterium]|nr:hypothetical protein [Legionellaceae bacterium]